jgi:dTDP-4-amino-4,6-dideoxygalactose transaminase
LGSISTLSFHATKAFHTFEGGGLVTNSASLSRKIRLLRNFGITDEEHVEIPGINAKMNEFCAVMGILNLKHFPKWQNQRSRLYKMYIDLLGHCGKLDFQSIPTEGYNYSYMPVIFADRRQRDYVHDRLVASGIKPRKYFFPATNDLSMQGFSSRDSTPVARNISLRILTLPLYASLEEEIVDNICDIVLQALS